MAKKTFYIKQIEKLERYRTYEIEAESIGDAFHRFYEDGDGKLIDDTTIDIDKIKYNIKESTYDKY